jgi:hypothetical protein
MKDYRGKILSNRLRKTGVYTGNICDIRPADVSDGMPGYYVCTSKTGKLFHISPELYAEIIEEYEKELKENNNIESFRRALLLMNLNPNRFGDQILKGVYMLAQQHISKLLEEELDKY